ncbi:MAG: hypothetical protein IT480_00825 [Gammaproteobacteria bacterium]|nr:hypothetical protein [Gammaproteobacteria bacterium]
MNSATAPEGPALIGDLPAIESARPADPFQALDDLMVVLEALCPRWPVRPPATDMTDMRL